MKKSKLLVGVLVASIALLGTGYAYWTDKLVVTTTVQTGKLEVVYESLESGKGELNEITRGGKIDKVLKTTYNYKPSSSSRQTYYLYPGVEEFLDEEGKVNGVKFDHKEAKDNEKPKFSGYYATNYYRNITVKVDGPSIADEELVTNDADANGAKGIEGYISAFTPTTGPALNVKGKTMTINMKDFYPGSFAKVEFVARNAGTIPAVINDVVSTPSMGGLEKEMKVVALLGDTKLTNEMVANAKYLSEIATVLQDAYMSHEIKGKLEPAGKGINSIKTTLVFIFPGSITGYEGLTDANAKSFDLTVNWRQHNALTKTTSGANLTASAAAETE